MNEWFLILLLCSRFLSSGSLCCLSGSLFGGSVLACLACALRFCVGGSLSLFCGSLLVVSGLI